MAVSYYKYWVLMHEEGDFRGWWSNSWQTDFFLVALFIGYINWFKYDRIEIRGGKWHWIVK